MFGRKSRFLGVGAECSPNPGVANRSICKLQRNHSQLRRFSEEEEKAGVNNLLGIYKVITGKSEQEVERDFESARGYGDLKKAVAEVVIEELTPIREEYEHLMNDVAELDRLLAIGADHAASISMPKVREMKEKMGLILP